MFPNEWGGKAGNMAELNRKSFAKHKQYIMFVIYTFKLNYFVNLEPSTMCYYTAYTLYFNT